MERHIRVHRRDDPAEAPPVAAIDLAGRVTADDPAVRAELRAALRERHGGWLPAFPGTAVSASPGRHPPGTRRWALAVHIALSRRGYRCQAIGSPGGSQ